jgi:FkbM family methyltransferase
MKSRFPNAKIICVEPDSDNFEALKKNLNSYTGVEAINAGLWHLDTKLNVVDKYNAGYSAMTVEEDPMKGNVRAVTVDGLMQAHGLDHIDVLKIDIETSENEVFSKNYESWLPKVKVIIIELHDWLRPGCSRVFFEAVHQCWKNYSYSVCGENTVLENKDLIESQRS